MPKTSSSFYYLGIDPGLSGGMVLLQENGGYGVSLAFGKCTDHEIADWICANRMGRNIVKAAIEQVHAMPGQGVRSMFVFGTSYGFLRGLLTAFQIPFIEVRPQVWQKALAIPPKGNKTTTEHKKHLQAKAHKLWPSSSQLITRAVADAALIAEYLRVQEVYK